MKQSEAAPSLDEQLAAARADAAQARATLDGIKARLTVAVREQRFGDAEQAQGELPEAEHAWAVAAAGQRALEGVLEHLARERHEHEVALQAERRRQLAAGHLNAAAARERELMDELSACKSEALAGLAAIQATLQRGFAIEGEVRQQRAIQAQARVDAGDADSVPGHISAPNLVSSFVERSQALTAILRGQALP